jgi:hypothetical protein|tara:strand:+ start:2171 stop:2365 length:195 start_codon:yes stop_codon:yes gene_type:complete
MARKKKKIIQPINEIEIINRRTRKYRKIDITEKEIIIYNEQLSEFQLLSTVSSSYDVNSETQNE